MGTPLEDAPILFRHVRDIAVSPPEGVKPWKARELVRLIEESGFDSDDKHVLYWKFGQRLVYLLDSPTDDRLVLLRKLFGHNLRAESRILSDTDQRDHLLHVSQVFLTGWLILHRCRLFSNPPPEWKPYNWSAEGLFQKLNECWLITSLLHDCGYSVEFAGASNRHEVLVKSTFGDIYDRASVGAVNAPNLAQHARNIWNLRASLIGLAAAPLDEPSIKKKHEIQLSIPDHALSSSKTVLDTSSTLHLPEDIYKIASISIACHNFQYNVDSFSSSDTPQNRWFSLSFEKEPLAALLHLCDEIQDWSRERDDEPLARATGSRPRAFQATYLTDISFPDPDQMTVQVQRRRELYPEDRPIAMETRMRLLQERKLAAASRRFSRLFPATYPDHYFDPRFVLRLRVTESVGGSACRSELRVNWPIRGSLISELSQENGRTREALTVGRFHSVQVTHQSRRVLEVSESGWHIEPNKPGGGRLALRFPGGRGKSTLMRQMAVSNSSKFAVYYVEQLPSELIDLRSDLERLIAQNSSVRCVLLIDHLDRLVEDDTLAFWQEQLANLDGLEIEVIIACRPEEFDRYFRAPLLNKFVFDELEWICDIKGITSTLTEQDRPPAAEIEKRISGLKMQEWRGRIASFAFHLGNQRGSKLEPEAGWLDRENLNLAGNPLIIRDKRGETRFIHDCAQDLYSAVYLCQWLLSRKDLDRFGEAMRHQPNDVFRLLIELLTDEGGRLFGSRDDARAARAAIAEAFTINPTVQQWLHDTGRLSMASPAIESWVAKNTDDAWTQAVALKLSGHTHYERTGPPQLRRPETRENALKSYRSAIHRWALAVKKAEDAYDAGAVGIENFRWMLSFLSDHLLLALTRVGSVPALIEESRRIAQEAAQRLSRRKEPRPLSIGWIRELLIDYSSFQVPEDVDRIFLKIEKALNECRKDDGGGIYHYLDVRRAHIACHIGLLFQDHAFDPDLTAANYRERTTDYELLHKAEYWFQTSISLRETVLLAMESGRQDAKPLNGEIFTTLALGASDAAHQYRGVFESQLLCLRLATSPPFLLEKMAVSYQLMKEAWGRAEYYLEPTERLGKMYAESVLHLATGKVISGLLGKAADIASSLDTEEITRLLEKALSDLIENLPYLAESSTRYKSGDFTPGRIMKRYQHALPNIPEVIVRALRQSQAV